MKITNTAISKFFLNNSWVLLAFTSLLMLFLLYFTRHYILTDSFYTANFVSTLSASQIEGWLRIQDKTANLGYVFVILLTMIKFLIIAFAIYTGLYLRGVETSIRAIFKTVITAELLFFIPALIKLILFIFFYTDFTYQDWLYFSPLSALHITGYKNVSSVWLYPLQIMNVFEVAYWLLLAEGLRRITPISFDKALKVVTTSYIPLLLSWVILVMLFHVLNNPGTLA